MGNNPAKGSCAKQFFCCTFCQYAECCCSKCCRYTKLGGDFVVCANIFPCCLCCRLAPERMVLLTGLQDAGKTTLLYHLLLGSNMQANPTKGVNNEIVSFNKWQKYEFWDPSGSPAQIALWPVYYNNMVFDFVVYVIDGYKWVGCQNSEKKETIFDEDRMELHALMNEDALKQAKFIVWLRFAQEVSPDDVQETIEACRDDLEVGPKSSYPKVEVIAGYSALKSALDIAANEFPGCFTACC